MVLGAAGWAHMQARLLKDARQDSERAVKIEKDRRGCAHFHFMKGLAHTAMCEMHLPLSSIW